MTTAAPSVEVSHWRFPGWGWIWLSLGIGAAAAVIEAMAVQRFATTKGRPEALAAFVFILASIFFAPVEEWLFRGVILRKLIRRTGPIAAALVSSALFAFAHGWKLPWWALRFAGGLVLGGVYLRSGSLWPSIALHFSHNAVLAAAITLLIR